MDMLNLKSLVLFLSAVGCCLAQLHTLPEGPVDGILGKNVTFPTTVGHKEEFITITWTFNGGESLVTVVTIIGATGEANVDDKYKGRVWVNGTTGVLTLGPLKAEDNGDYAMTMVQTKQTLAGETTLRVLVPVSNVAIKSNMAEAIELNSTVVLTCSAKGSFLKYSWINNTMPIVADGKRLTLNKDSTVLTVTGVLRSDLVGPIYCKVSNKLEEEKSAPFNLTVSYGPENIAMTGMPATPVLKKGSNITLACSAQSSPPATLTWFHNGAIMKETGPKLVLSDIKEKQGGNYSCTAHNAKTLHSVSSALAKFTVLEAISGTKITGPTSTLIAGNHTANLSCLATAGTIATRAWLKDNKPLSPSDRVVISGDTVMIKKVQKEDNGEYKCQLSNAVNSDSDSYKMVVNFGPEPAAVEGPEAVEVKDPVEIKCSAISIPTATYTWKFNGTLKTVTMAVYTIDSAVYKNTGMYTCEAHNAVTGLSTSATHKLSVKEEGALDEGLSDGAIAGIVIGVLVALAAAIAGVIYFRRKQEVASPY